MANPLNCLMAISVLAIAGFHVIETARAEEALALEQSGRAERVDGGWKVSWMGVRWRGRFEGTSVGLDRADNAWYSIRLDGRQLDPVPPSGERSTFWVRNLPNARHEIEVVRQTGSPESPGTFYGLKLDDDDAKALGPPSRPSRRVEFIGDSSMTGYGALCPDGVKGAKSDATFGYPILAARLMDAEWSLIAANAAGIVTNCCGGQSSPNLIERYFGIAPGGREWRPHVVVLGMGAADELAIMELPKDQWAQATGKFAEAYDAFLSRLRDQYGADTLIVAVEPKSLIPGFIDEIKNLVARRTERGDEKLVYFAAPSGAFSGCSNHRNARENSDVATALANAIERAGAF